MSLSLTCTHCDCDNYREELMGSAAIMISSEGNCKNCNHPVNVHPRRPATYHTVVSSAPIVPIAMSENVLVTDKAHVMTGKEVLIQNPLSNYQASSLQQQDVSRHPNVQLRNIPLDHSGSHIPLYDPTRGYVTNTGTVYGNTTQGDYNSFGATGPGVNGTVQSTGGVAYGGEYASQYEGGYYSAKRVGTSSAPIAQTIEVSVSNDNCGVGSINFDEMRSQYGSDGYSAKRLS